MTLNDVLKSVIPILQRLQELAPVVYANGTIDKATILIHFPEAQSYEKEVAFEFLGATAAQKYILGDLTHVYYARTRRGFPNEDEKKSRELLHIDSLNVVTNTQEIFLYEIQKKHTTLYLKPIDFDELNDPWSHPLLLPAFVKGYQRGASINGRGTA